MENLSNEVGSFIKALIEVGGIHYVEESPDKIIRNVSDDSPVNITVDGRPVPLAIFGTNNPEVIMVNPFIEGDAENGKATWLYQSSNLILAAHIRKIMMVLLETGAASKKKGGTDEPNRKATEMVSKWVTSIDDKMIKEFNTLSSNLTDFCCIYYNKNNKRSEFRCIIANEAQRKAFSTIRKGTWEVLEGLLYTILQVENLAEFDYTPQLISVPLLEAYTHTLVEVYDKLQDAMSLIDRHDKHIPALRSHLKYLSDYYHYAKMYKTPSTASYPSAPAPVAPAQYGPYGINGGSGYVSNVPAPAYTAPMGMVSTYSYGVPNVPAPVCGFTSGPAPMPAAVAMVTPYPAAAGYPASQPIATLVSTDRPLYK